MNFEGYMERSWVKRREERFFLYRGGRSYGWFREKVVVFVDVIRDVGCEWREERERF